MKILLACEFSGIVRDAFIARGHDAWSADLLPTAEPGPHIQGDVLSILHDDWDMIIAFPPCTHLAASGARHFKQKIADGRQQQGIDFFMAFTNLSCPKVAIENPKGIMSKRWRKPDQIIHPWMFGQGFSKGTCLWLKGLPLLVPTNIVKGRQKWTLQRRHAPSPRGVSRSITFPCIAEAMADQWGSSCLT